MIKPSGLTLANLAIAAILLLTPFLVGVTASAPYDPWYDLDGNGAIDIFDVVRIAGTYGTTGDSAKNVTISSYSARYATQLVTVAAHGAEYLEISTLGAREVTLAFTATVYQFDVEVRWRVATMADDYMVEWFTITSVNHYTMLKTYPVHGHTLKLRLINLDLPVATTVYVSYYITA